MTENIGKSKVLLGLVLVLARFQSCATARAQIILQDGSTTSVADNYNSNSISQTFTVTPGASVLVVSLYDQNNVANDSGPATIDWGSQPLAKIGGQYNARAIYASSDIWCLLNPAPGTNTITATDNSGGTVTAMAMQIYTLNNVDTSVAPVFYSSNAAYGTNATINLSGSTPAGAWAVLNFSYGFNSSFDMSIQSTSGSLSFGQVQPGTTGDDVIMGVAENLAAGATAISVGNAIGGGVQNALAVAVFQSAGINTNLVTPRFSGLTISAPVIYGSTSVPLSGTASANGSYLPPGTIITVTIDGNAQQTTINDSTGDFSIDYNVAGLPVSPVPYPVVYSSAPATKFLAATNSNTTLTINPLPLVLSGYLVANGTATVPAANLTVANLSGSDDLALSGSVTIAATNAGPQAITSFNGLTLGGAAAGNYTLNGASGTVSVIGTGGVQSPGLTNWIGVFNSPSDINGWAFAGGSESCTLSYLAGDAPPWGPSSGALVMTVSVPGGAWTEFAKSLNGTNLANYNQLEFDVKVGTNQTVWDNYGEACSTLEPFVTFGSGNTPSGGPQPGIPPAAGNNGWQHMVIPAADFGPTTNLADVQQMVFEMFDGYFPVTANMVLEFANIEWDSPPVVVSPAITLNPGKLIRAADSRWFGINTGFYDYDFNLPHTVPESQAAGWTIFRYPGGAAADGFDWQQYTTSGQNNPFNNFAQVVTNLGAQAMITVNYGTGTPQEAAAWVAYANITNHLGFKYWEVGNEVYAYPTEVDSNSPGHDPWEYGQRAAQYIQQMKAVDPTIKVGVVVVPGLELDPGTNSPHFATNLVTGQVFSGWTPVVMSQLRQAGVTPDFAIYHDYAENGAENDQTLLADDNWATDAAELRGDIDDFLGSSGTNVELLITENNSEAGIPGKQSVSLVNGLYYADSLGQIAQTEFNGRLWWQLHDGNAPFTSGDMSPDLYGWRMYGSWGVMDWENGLALTNRYPSYFAAALLTHFITGGDEVVDAQSDLPLVSAYGALRTNGDLTLLLINKSATNYYQAGITVTNWVPGESATVYSYGMPQDNAAKGGNNDACGIVTNTCTAGANFEYTLAPYSMNVLVFNQNSQAPSLSILPLSPANPGQFVLQLTGQPDVSYILQSSPDLFDWTSVATNTLSGATINITNPIVPGAGQQFWRALRRPN